MSGEYVNVLDHGMVKLVGHLGNDLTVVNSARVSFGKHKKVMDASDEKLIKYLAEHKHWSPFRHVQFQFHCKVPEFIARQWYKHVVGMSYTSIGEGEKDHAWNEISMRYSSMDEADFYIPDAYRMQSADNRQASTDELVTYDLDGTPFSTMVTDVTFACKTAYEALTAAGIAREQARMILPLNIYTEFYWTTSLQGLVNFIQLRKHAGAQYEIQQYAMALESLVEDICPVSIEALLGDD